MSKTYCGCGAGLIGRSHINVVQAAQRSELTAVVDPSPEADAIARAAMVPLYRTLEDLLQQARPDGIVLATPNQLHVPQALQCIEAGVACLLESRCANGRGG